LQLRIVGQLHIQREVGLAGLLHHEGLQRAGAGVERLAHRDPVFRQRQVGVGIDLVQHRAHHEQRQEQGQAHHHLVGRRGLRAQRLAQQRQDDDDAGEAGHHQQRRRQEGQAGQQQHGLQAEGVVLAAVGSRGAGQRRQALGERAERQQRRRDDKAACGPLNLHCVSLSFASAMH
jgi:hypothetical protein